MKFQADHPHHDEGSGYNVRGSSWAQAERQSNSELIIRLWCTRVTPRSCSLISIDWRGIGPCCASSGITSENPEISLAGVFFKEASSVENNPFWANVSIGGGFSVLCRSQSRFIPIITKYIGCDKVRSDCLQMYMSCVRFCRITAATAASKWFLWMCHALFFVFSICLNEWGRAEGLAHGHLRIP